MGSEPAMDVHESRLAGQPYVGDDWAGVSATRSPPPLALVEQPPWNVWYCYGEEKGIISLRG